MLNRRGVVALGLAALVCGPARAQDAAVDALRRGEALALMRHALAPGVGDPANFTLGDCSTQRTLSDQGRAQAQRVGATLREALPDGVPRVLTSQWCRCRETAELLDIGPVEDAPSFNSFFAGRGDRGAQTEAALALLREVRLPVVVVSHQVNISALTGQSTRSGEVLIVRPGAGGLDVLGSLYRAP